MEDTVMHSISTFIDWDSDYFIHSLIYIHNGKIGRLTTIDLEGSQSKVL